MKRLARAVEQEDQRANPPIAQVVFYQSGVGSEENLFSHYVEGAVRDPINNNRSILTLNAILLGTTGGSLGISFPDVLNCRT